MVNSKKGPIKISYKNKHEAGALGIISGSTGPDHEERVSKQNEFYEYVASKIRPNEKSIYDLENYLVREYGAEEYSPNQNELENFKVNLILSEYPDVIKRTIQISEDSGIEDLIRSRNIDDPFGQAKKYKLEELGVDLAFYCLGTENREKLKNIKVLIDRKTNYIQVINDSEGKLTLEILSYIGVSQQDINQRNSRFKSYVFLLRELGKI